MSFNYSLNACSFVDVHTVVDGNVSGIMYSTI